MHKIIMSALAACARMLEGKALPTDSQDVIAAIDRLARRVGSREDIGGPPLFRLLSQLDPTPPEIRRALDEAAASVAPVAIGDDIEDRDDAMHLLADVCRAAHDWSPFALAVRTLATREAQEGDPRCYRRHWGRHWGRHWHFPFLLEPDLLQLELPADIPRFLAPLDHVVMILESGIESAIRRGDSLDSLGAYILPVVEAAVRLRIAHPGSWNFDDLRRCLAQRFLSLPATAEHAQRIMELMVRR